MTKPFILIESPFSAPTMPELIHNIQYAQQSVIYDDLGISSGMEYGIKTAKDANRQIITRSLFPDAKSRQEVIEQMLEEYSRHDLPSPEVLASIYGRILK